MSLLRYNNELVDTFKKVKAVDPTAIPSNLEGSLAEAYVGDLDFLERMYGYGDYIYKVSGSTVENPNIVKTNASATLTPANTFPNNELGQVTGYDKIKSLDGNVTTANTLTNTYMSMQLFSFDILTYLEKRYGVWVWQGNTSLVSKVTRAKAIIKGFQFSWWGNGSGPSGNASTFVIFNATSNAWGIGSTNYNGASIGKVSVMRNDATNLSNWIDVNGLAHALAYCSSASNGTIASVINTDYVKLEILVDTSKL